MPPEKSAIRRVLPAVPHYYGDVARILMLCGAGLMLLGTPFADMPISGMFPILIVAALVIVGFAALTNPWKRWIIAADAAASAVAAAFFEIVAYLSYQNGGLTGFVLCEGVAILFLFAFYFSMKTFRAMMLHQVGKPDSIVEFRRTKLAGEQQEDPLEAEESFKIPPKYE